jgi:hypothetical protein
MTEPATPAVLAALAADLRAQRERDQAERDRQAERQNARDADNCNTQITSTGKENRK